MDFIERAKANRIGRAVKIADLEHNMDTSRLEKITSKDVERLILNMPFRRFEDMHAVHHAKQLGTIQFYKSLFNQMTEEDFSQIRESSKEALKRYFGEE